MDDANCAQVFQDLIRFYREVAAREGEPLLLQLQRDFAQLLPGVPADTLLQVIFNENDQNRFRNFFREFAKLLPPT